MSQSSSVEARLEEVVNALKENADHTTALSSKVDEDLDKIRLAYSTVGFDFESR